MDRRSQNNFLTGHSIEMTQYCNIRKRFDMACFYNYGYSCNLRIDISTQAKDDNHNEKYKSEKMKEIMLKFCALINSHGGHLTLKFEPMKTTDLRNLIRSIEQRLSDVLGYSKMRDIINPRDSGHGELVFDVKNVSGLSTLNYNLYIPTETQVLAMPSKTPVTDIKEILCSKAHIVEVEDYVTSGTLEQFVFQKSVAGQLRQSKTVEFKYLKDEKSKCVSLGDRITNKSNKFTSYVSAFANHHGGHIYYGVDDEGIVQGERVVNKQEIIKKVNKAINKMVWPMKEGPIKGQQWEIFFEPVKHSIDSIIPCTFVIVIWVAYCPGGVFTAEPESYHIVEGKVRRMSFEEWRRRIFHTHPQKSIAGVQWSSRTAEKTYFTLMKELLFLRNNGNKKDFEIFVERVKRDSLSMEKRNSHSTEKLLVVLSQEAAFACRRNELKAAGRLIKEFDELCDSAENKDSLVFQCLGLFIKSSKERCEENFTKSYNTAISGLQVLELISSGLNSAWFYVHIASLLSTLAFSSKTTEDECGEKIANAKTLYARALEQCRQISKFPELVADVQQTIYIVLAAVYLRCSVNGTMKLGAELAEQDFQSARNCLLMVSKLINEGYPLNALRESQYLMVQSCLWYRRSQLPGSTTGSCVSFLKFSFNYCQTALTLASQCNLEELKRNCRRQVERVIDEARRLGISESNLKDEMNQTLKF